MGKVLGADAGEPEDEMTSLSGRPALPTGEDAGAPGNSKYVLRMKVSDPSTASATVNVIVTVTNVNEPPKFNENVPTFLRVEENADPLLITVGYSSTPLGSGAYAATDEDGDDDSFVYTLSGADSRYFNPPSPALLASRRATSHPSSSKTRTP